MTNIVGESDRQGAEDPAIRDTFDEFLMAWESGHRRKFNRLVGVPFILGKEPSSSPYEAAEFFMDERRRQFPGFEIFAIKDLAGANENASEEIHYFLNALRNSGPDDADNWYFVYAKGEEVVEEGRFTLVVFVETYDVTTRVHGVASISG